MVKLVENKYGKIAVDKMVIEKAIFEELNKSENIKCQQVELRKNYQINVKVKVSFSQSLKVLEKTLATAISNLNAQLESEFVVGNIIILS